MGDADWKPASRELGGAWASIHELDNEIPALKKDTDTGLWRQAMQIGRGWLSPHRLCEQTGSVSAKVPSETGVC